MLPNSQPLIVASKRTVGKWGDKGEKRRSCCVDDAVDEETVVGAIKGR